jgi:hypothetical protein
VQPAEASVAALTLRRLMETQELASPPHHWIGFDWLAAGGRGADAPVVRLRLPPARPVE